MFTKRLNQLVCLYFIIQDYIQIISMQVTLSNSQKVKSAISNPIQIPTHIQSMLSKFEVEAQKSIAGQHENLTNWFITNVLKYRNPQIPRLVLLNSATKIVVNNIPNPKYINQLFLEQNSIVSLLQQADNLVDIGFVLLQHSERKVKPTEHCNDIVNTTKSCVSFLLRKNEAQLDSMFCVNQVCGYIAQKQRIPESIYIVDAFERDQNEAEVILIFRQVFKLLFEKKTLTDVYDCLYRMVYWFVIIKDETVDKQMILLDIAKKIDSFLWTRKSADNINLIRTFTKVLDLLSCKYHQSDSFSPFTLAPLLIKLRGIPYSELINNWMATQKDKNVLPKLIESIFRNTLFTGCSVFCFQIIQSFSHYLHQIKNYEILFHLFDSFIRKDYLSIKLPNGSFVRSYLNILMFYAIGFINRDRLDGETELDRLANNLCELVCIPNFKYDQCCVQIIKFFRIYQNRFQFLSNTCKKFVSQLQKIYNVNFPIAVLHQQVGNRIFKQYNADYKEDQIYALQKSTRYSGLLNLGNTCYMNSFVQSLFMTKKFKTMVIKAQDQGIVPTNHPVFQALVELFSELNSKTTENRTQVNPSLFKKQIPQPFKSSWQQHDSGQFGRMYLDMVTSQLKDTALADKINRLFTHDLVTKIICKGCHTQRQKQQNIFDFILNVEQNTTQIITVSDLLKKYYKGYELDQHNFIYCQRCRKNMPTIVLHEPLQLAEHLITTISIFKYDKNGSSKIIKPLNFEFSLNFKNILPKLVTQDQTYDLYAFVLHIGTGVERGHYQCFARNLQQNPMLWYKFDDHYVTEQQINSISDFHFGQNETPYILFYSNTNKTRKVLQKQ